MTAFRIEYRTGGYLNYQWKRVLDTYATEGETRAKAASVERMGFPTRIVPVSDTPIDGRPGFRITYDTLLGGYSIEELVTTKRGALAWRRLSNHPTYEAAKTAFANRT